MLIRLKRTFVANMNPTIVVVVVAMAVAVFSFVDSAAIGETATSTTTSTSLVDTLDCDPTSEVCWPKCCLADQVFDLSKFRCNHVEDSSKLLLKPEIHSLRYKKTLRVHVSQADG